MGLHPRRHFIVFSPQDEHLRGLFIMFSPMKGHLSGDFIMHSPLDGHPRGYLIAPLLVPPMQSTRMDNQPFLPLHNVLVSALAS